MHMPPVAGPAGGAPSCLPCRSRATGATEAPCPLQVAMTPFSTASGCRASLAALATQSNSAPAASWQDKTRLRAAALQQADLCAVGLWQVPEHKRSCAWQHWCKHLSTDACAHSSSAASTSQSSSSTPHMYVVALQHAPHKPAAAHPTCTLQLCNMHPTGQQQHAPPTCSSSTAHIP